MAALHEIGRGPLRRAAINGDSRRFQSVEAVPGNRPKSLDHGRKEIILD
jgi:hypothetical protein